MRQNIRITILFCLLYIALCLASMGPLFMVAGGHETSFAIALVLAIALIPGTAIIMTLLPKLRWRTQKVVAKRSTQSATVTVMSHRQRFEFAFAAWNGIESNEAVARLSRRLSSLEINHQYQAGEITVTDGDLRWRVMPVVGQLRISGWVDSPEPSARAMVIQAVEEFLIDELGISLERQAA